jgi:peptidyl-Lys metalloendopeptidase
VGGGWSKKDHRMCNDNPLGVVVHELTHLFAATEDHVYGRTECKQLAISNHTEARENADNFEYYCEDVLLGKY